MGISRCLLGERVRYDGGHKREEVLIDLAARIEWVEVCPEVESGLPTPRPPMRLEAPPRGDAERGVRLMFIESRRDYTEPQKAWAAARLATLVRAGLDGFVLKSRSPNCGLDVPIWSDDGIVDRGRGVWADAIAMALPDVPLEDEERLRDPRARDAFLERVFAHWRERRT